jgi:hypothetical protein
MMITLPTKKTEVNSEFKHQRFGMLGLAGIGKSEFWAQDENAIFLNTEGGLNALKVYEIPIRCWNDLREAYMALKEASDKGAFPYSVIVIDTIDRLIDYAQEEVVARAKEFYKKMEINAIGDIPNGNGWYKQKEMIMGFLTKLELLPCAISYIAHSDIKRIKETSAEYDKITISIGGQLGDDLLAFTDHTLNIEAHRIGDKLQRIVYTMPTQSREAKSRGSMIPNGIKWSDNMAENYKAFRALFK